MRRGGERVHAVDLAETEVGWRTEGRVEGSEGREGEGEGE